MEFSSHRDFITPNVLVADCCLRQWYDYKGCVCVMVFMSCSLMAGDSGKNLQFWDWNKGGIIARPLLSALSATRP